MTMNTKRTGPLEITLSETNTRVSFEYDPAAQRRQIEVVVGARSASLPFDLNVEGSKWTCAVFLMDPPEWRMEGTEGVMNAPVSEEQLQSLIQTALQALHFSVTFITTDEQLLDATNPLSMVEYLHPNASTAPSFTELGKWHVFDQTDGTEILFMKISHPLSPGFKLYAAVYRLGDKFIVFESDSTPADFSSNVKLSFPFPLKWFPFDPFEVRKFPDREVVREKLITGLKMMGLNPTLIEPDSFLS